MELQNRQKIIKRKTAYPQRAVNALNTYYKLQLKDYKTFNHFWTKRDMKKLSHENCIPKTAKMTTLSIEKILC